MEKRERIGKRDWEVQVDSATLAGRTATRTNYHAERQAHWQELLDEAEDELREKGIEIRSYQATGGPQMQAVVDQELGQRVTTFRAKRDHHQAEKLEYGRWTAFLLEKRGQLMLNIEEFSYFQPNPNELEDK